MKYLIAIFLLAINLYAYQYSINPIIFFLASIVLYCSMYIIEKRRKKSTQCIILEMLCFSWAFSWTNILGTSTNKSSNQITWFYVIGIFAFLNFILHNRELRIKKGNLMLDIAFITIFVYSIIPLIMANNFKDGFPDFLTTIFFCLMVFVCYKSRKNLTHDEFNGIINCFIFVNVICSIIILIQYFIYQYNGVILFKMAIMGSFNGKMQIGGLVLMEDASSATMMLGCGILCALIKARDKKIFYLIAALIAVGLAFTGRRTGFVALLLIIPFFSFFQYKGLIKKFFIFLIMMVSVLCAIILFNKSRPMDDASQLLDDNGRISDYIASVELILSCPFGIGYGDTYLATRMVRFIPHNTILRLMNFGGILLTLPIMIILFKVAKKAYNEKNWYCFWSILYSSIGMNFIPDIFNARFLTIICMLSFLYINNEEAIESVNDGLMLKH